jgi:hypothetical protein
MRILIFLIKMSQVQTGWVFRELIYRWNSLISIENSWNYLKGAMHVTCN